MIASVTETSRTQNPQAGFTLLELLVAITLMGLLSVVLLGGLRFGARVWEVSDRHNLGGNEIRRAQMRLRHDIERAWPFFDTSDSARPQVRFEGGKDRLDFLAPAPSDLASGGYVEVHLVTVERDGVLRLLMRTRPELAGEGQPVREEILLSELSELKFSYFGADAVNGDPFWHESWKERTHLPALIRIEARFTPEDGRSWPDFSVAPRIEADVTCVFDPFTHFCKGR